MPGASRSTGSLEPESSFFGAGRWGGCFQMSGSCRRGWYTDSSELSSLPALHAPKLHSEMPSMSLADLDVTQPKRRHNKDAQMALSRLAKLQCGGLQFGGAPHAQAAKFPDHVLCFK